MASLPLPVSSFEMDWSVLSIAGVGVNVGRGVGVSSTVAVLVGRVFSSLVGVGVGVGCVVGVGVTLGVGVMISVGPIDLLLT